MKRLAAILLLTVFACGAQGQSRPSRGTFEGPSSPQTTLTTAQIAKQVSPSVIVIQGKTASGEALGSGFIVSRDGKIVTNFHVIRDMVSATVQLASGEVIDSILILGADPARDLAIIQIVGHDLPALAMGDSDALTVGEPLVVVGSPRGLEGTVTAGILSSVRDSGQGFTLLQTDAAVNPGNSGGPLVNNKGSAIGVISFKLKSAEGLNFAIPIRYVRLLLGNLHEPITLDQFRKQVSASPRDRALGTAALTESLTAINGMLSETFVQETIRDEVLGQVDISYGSIPRSITSCDLVIDFATSMKAKGSPDLSPRVTIKHFSFRLGSLDKAVMITTEASPIPIFDVVFGNASNVIAVETVDTYKKGDIQKQMVNQIPFRFHDKSLAVKFLAVFKQAAESCRSADGQ